MMSVEILPFNVKQDSFYVISDLHLLHTNIFPYNFKTRFQFIEDYFPNIQSLRDNNVMKDNLPMAFQNELAQIPYETLSNYIYKANTFFLKKLITLFNTYLLANKEEWKLINLNTTSYQFNIKDINEDIKWWNKFFIDLWDTFFHFSKGKIDDIFWWKWEKGWYNNIFKNNYTEEFYKTLQNYYNTIKDNWYTTYHIKWNHDNIKQTYLQEWYQQWYDSLTKYLIFKDDKNKVIRYFTHIPLWNVYLNIKHWEKHEKIIPYEEEIAIIELLENYHKKWYEIQVFYGHMHDKSVLNDEITLRTGKKIDYSDFTKERIKENEYLNFLNENIILINATYDYQNDITCSPYQHRPFKLWGQT